MVKLLLTIVDYCGRLSILVEKSVEVPRLAPRKVTPIDFPAKLYRWEGFALVQYMIVFC